MYLPKEDKLNMEVELRNFKVEAKTEDDLGMPFIVHVFSDPLLNRHMATWNLFVIYDKELKYKGKKPFYFKFHHFDRHEYSTFT